MMVTTIYGPMPPASAEGTLPLRSLELEVVLGSPADLYLRAVTIRGAEGSCGFLGLPLPAAACFRVDSSEVRHDRPWDFKSLVLVVYRLRFFYPADPR